MIYNEEDLGWSEWAYCLLKNNKPIAKLKQDATNEYVLNIQFWEGTGYHWLDVKYIPEIIRSSTNERNNRLLLRAFLENA
jgi:hypothetical protein